MVPLPWSTRMKIALGAAKGLAFLHEAEKPVIYRDFKTSNILLDEPPAAAGSRKSRWGPPPPAAASAGDKGASTSARTPTPTQSADSRRHPAPSAPASHARNPASPAAAFRPPPQQQQAVETPPPPPYGFHNLDRRTMLLADGTVRTYFALPPDYPFEAAPLPPFPHLPRAGPDLWPPHQPPPQYMPMPMPPHDAKRKHPADHDEGFPRHPKQPRFDAPRHPPQLPPHGAVDRHALRRAFLKYAKMLNENSAQRRSYLEGGRVSCLACGRSRKLHSKVAPQITPAICDAAKLGFYGGKSKSLYGKEGHLGLTLIKFADNPAGLKEAERLAEFLERHGHGRIGWSRAQASRSVDSDQNPLLFETDKRTVSAEFLYACVPVEDDFVGVGRCPSERSQVTMSGHSDGRWWGLDSDPALQESVLVAAPTALTVFPLGSQHGRTASHKSEFSLRIE
ncbi:hypothetical protein PR202_ga26996 [Eleusine coracana subsp. coracana]|uniref:XS domain-containing protein n=1 Tax=Eleusine coracana subsp. coracana TaxID=191504 RepID=A0AAV5DDJ7_ELECO|nr:hypothetical protein PR202_ga26996 [Eleusine coracana subsp. coracana]